MFLFTSVVACAPDLLFSIDAFHEFLKLFQLLFIYIFETFCVTKFDAWTQQAILIKFFS